MDKRQEETEAILYTQEEWIKRLDEEARLLLGMSGFEFVHRAEAGKLGRGLNDHLVWMTYNMVDEEEKPFVRERLRQLAKASLDSPVGG